MTVRDSGAGARGASSACILAGGEGARCSWLARMSEVRAMCALPRQSGCRGGRQIFTHILPVFRIFRERTKMNWCSAVNRSNCVPSCYSFLGRYTLNAVLLNLRWYERNYCPLLSMCATRINIVMFLLPTSNFSLAQTLRANKSMTFKDFCSISAFAHEYGFHMLIILL